MNKYVKIYQSSIESLYSGSYDVFSKEGKKVDIPVEGSLGLLALGAKGLIAWRKKRDSSEKLKK